MEATEIICKLVLLVLMTQMGKTFTTIHRISNEIENDEEMGRSIHMVFTMNTLLSGRQFSKRLNTLETLYGIGTVVVFASKYNGPYKHVKKLEELKGICMDSATCPRVIIMCSNDTRFDDGVTFIDTLNNNRTNIERIYVYYDELHKYITATLRTQIQHIHDLSIVKGVLALTATPKPIWQSAGFWSSIRMIQLDDFNEKDYCGYKDMIFNCVDDFFSSTYIRPKPFDFETLDEHTIGFVRHVLTKYPNIISNDTRTFIPAHYRVCSHNRVKEMVLEINPTTVVVILNGKEKCIHYRGADGFTKTIDIGECTEDKEACERIAEVIHENHLVHRPLVITGFLCVGMGQTLTHQSIGPFTSAIFGHMDLTNDEIYQLFGRVTGRMKNWGSKYCKTEVYCPTIIKNRCVTMEECARRVATDYNGELVTEDMYDRPMHESGEVGQDAIANIRQKKEVKVKKPKRPSPKETSSPFATIAEVNAFLSNIFKKPHRIRKFHEKDGWQLSTRLNAWYKKKMNELIADDRLTEEFYKNIPIGMNISSKVGTGQQYMVYPVYPTKESAKEDVRYYVRYLDPTSTVSTS